MSPQVVAASIAASVSFLTLIGTLAAQYFGRRATSRDLKEQGKRLDATLAEQRTRTLNERFATAAEQLGSDKPPAVRLAGVYAMAGLADDWPENRQTCVDVLCAYLRMPYEPNPGQDAPEPERLAFRASREVRHTVIRVIVAHLKDHAAVSWQGLNLDFTGVVFDGGNFRGARFSGGTVSFERAKFSGGIADFAFGYSGEMVDFGDAMFSGGKVYFDAAEFSDGPISFVGASFSGSTVRFFNAKFSGRWISFGNARFSGGEVEFRAASFSGRSISFVGTRFSGGHVSFDAEFSGGTVDFSGEFSGGTVHFMGAEFSRGTVSFGASFSGSTVSFSSAKFSGSKVWFGTATFSGGTVDFRGARFSGGEVDFSQVNDWSSPPTFPWTATPPPGVKLPQKKDQSQA